MSTTEHGRRAAEGTGHGHDPVEMEHQQQRVEFLRSFGVVGGSVGAVLSLGYFFGLHLVVGSAVLATCAACDFALPLLARRVPVALAGHVAAALVLVPVAYVSSLRGDLPLGALIFLCVPPVATGYLSGARAAMGWALASVALIALAFWRVHVGLAAFAPELQTPDAMAQRDGFEAVGMVGAVLLMTGMALSIERRRRLVERERQRLGDELERRRGAARVGRLAAGVAHEINNPLAWMTSGTSWLGTHLAAPAGTEPAEVLAELGEGLRRVSRIVAHLQAVARPGSVEDGAAPARVLEIVETLGQCDEAGERRREPLRIQAAAELPRVRASEGLLAQLLLDLVLDSRGESVTVRAARHEGRVLFAVSPAPPEDAAMARAVVAPWGGTVQVEGAGLQLSLEAQHFADASS